MSSVQYDEKQRRARSDSEGPASTPGRRTLNEGALPDQVRTKMESAFGSDFSDVRVHTGSGKADEAGARAFTQGSDIHFGAGEYDPSTPAGQELIGHELTHVVQQREGRVAGPQNKGGLPINDDHGLEAEADAMGARAAGGQSTGMSPTSAGGSSSAAPMQLKKKGWQKGTELTEHKPGSAKAKQDYLELMDADDDSRAGKIAALFTNRSSSKNQRFYHLQMWLGGQNKDLESAYQTKTGHALRKDLKDNLSKEQYDYCCSMLTNGVPTLEDKIRLSLGMLTGSAADEKEVLLLLIGGEDHSVEAADKLRAWGTLEPELKTRLSSKKYDQLKSHIESTRLEGQITRINNGGQASQNQIQMLHDAKEQELVALVKAQKGSLAMKRDKLGVALPEWASRQDDDTRAYVTRPNSLFIQALQKEVKSIFGKELLFTSHDVAYAVACIQNAKKIDEKFFGDGEEEAQMTGKAQEKRAETRQDEGTKHGEFLAYFERKENEHADKKWQWGTLKEKIEEMSPQQRDWFLRDQLSPAEKLVWDDEEVAHDRKMRLRDAAILSLDIRLKGMGMEGDGLLNRGGDSTRKKILEAFRYGASENVTAGGSTYQRLLKHAKEDTDKKKFGKKALALTRKLRGDEFAHVRGNADLMTALQTKSDAKYWDRLQAMLGIGGVGAHDKAKGDVDADVLNASESQWISAGRKADLKKHDLETAQDLGENEAELMPSHWGMMFTAALKEAHSIRQTEMNSLVNRCYTAGKKREQLTANGPLKLSGNRKLEPMTASDFVTASYASISAGALKALESHKSGKLHHAYEALKGGTRVTVDNQLADAEYAKISLKNTSGFHASMEGIVHSFEDIDGKDLLNEWSNFDQLRTHKRAFDDAKAGNDTGQMKLRAELIRDFVIDVRDDRIQWLEKTMPRGELVKTLGKIRKKLTTAMASDSEAIEALRAQGYANDEYSQARTKNLALLDQQRIRSTGAQYNTFLGSNKQIKAFGTTVIGSSALSAESKESTGTLLGHTRKAQHDLRQGVDRTKVVDDHASNIKDSQEELERRGESFDKMQKAYNKIVEGLAKALVLAVAVAAMGVVTVLTGGVGGAVGVAIIAGKTLLTSLVMAGVKKALQGDSFNGEKVFWDTVFKTVINTGFAAVGAFAMPEILGALGEGVVSQGDNITSTTEFVKPTDVAHAAWRTALEFGLKKGAKGIFKEAVRAARDTDTNPANRAMIMLHMGSVVAQIGAKVGAASYAEYNEDLQSSGATDPEKKASAQFNKVLGKSPKAIKVGAKALEAKLAPDESVKGSGHGSSAETIVQSAIQAAEIRAQALKQQEIRAQNAGQDASDITAEWMEVVQRLYDLMDLYDAWKSKQKSKGKDDTLDKVKDDTSPILESAYRLLEFLHKPPQQQQGQGLTANATP